jgi:hypothetical protein
MFEGDDLVVEVPKDELLEVLRKNRDGHRAVFEQAVDRYHAKGVELLADRIARMRNRPNAPVVIGWSLPVPEDHTADYDRVIAMIGRHVGETIRISEGKYRNYVDDEWGWTRAWRGSTESYVR